MIFAFLFGLSMDYEVFMLARMRGLRRDRRHDSAVALGLARTGKLVTSAALDPDVRVLRALVGAGRRRQAVRRSGSRRGSSSTPR